MTTEKHDGLIRNENGVIGEARARAFLAERFWILERSVDVDGADMLIQRRLTRLSDKDPPRLGIVQVKYLQDEKTTVYISPSYIGDSEGPFREFFLLVYTGRGDSARAFLLSAKEIAGSFMIAPPEHTYKGKYILSGRFLLTPKYRLDSIDRGLDRIEQALRLADLERNRRFLFTTTPFFVSPSREQIEPEYLVPLDNWWGDIAEEFFKMKGRAQDALYGIEDIAESLSKIVLTSDPEAALAIAEGLDSDMRDGYIRVSAHDLYDRDLHSVVRHHRRQHDHLRDDGLLEAYISLKTRIEEFVINDLLGRLPLAEDMGYAVDLHYNASTFGDLVFVGEIMKIPDGVTVDAFLQEEECMIISKPGWIKYLWPIGAWKTRSGPEELSKSLSDTVWKVRQPMMDKMYELKYPNT